MTRHHSHAHNRARLERAKRHRTRGNTWILPDVDAVNQVVAIPQAENVIVQRMAAWERDHGCTCTRDFLVEYFRYHGDHVYTLWHAKGCPVEVVGNAE